MDRDKYFPSSPITINLVQANRTHLAHWLSMRSVLWPGDSTQVHQQEINEILRKRNQTAFLAYLQARPVGFIECSIRQTAIGCKTRNVGYIEGWFVDLTARRQGLGSKLVQAAENWARAKGCREIASDCHDNNVVSLKAHLALGYKEANRLIHFHKTL